MLSLVQNKLSLLNDGTDLKNNIQQAYQLMHRYETGLDNKGRT